MTTMVLSLILINDIADTAPVAIFTMFGRFADSIQSRRFVTMTESTGMNVSGCSITFFQQPAAACILVFYEKLRGYDR